MERTARSSTPFTEEDVYAARDDTLEQCLLHGVTHMRTHVEVDPNVGCAASRRVERLARTTVGDRHRAVRVPPGRLDQRTTAPRQSSSRRLQARRQLVGGAPRYDTDGQRQIDRIFELASEFDVDVDIHLDGGNDGRQLDIYPGL